jgi:hypothetical protein
MLQIRLMLLFLAVLAVLAFFRRSMIDTLIQGIRDIVDHLGGGPPRPTHPSPANDAGLLRRRPT